ncbi:hypothetical protein DPMN_010716 [Dreissena polymorpha]|uniref:Uncharacterized protein n=1 Tax=Dreissena polymorpha TaxID=45954 RepID=A0A9D4N2J8_DREPO|nr:hypothetical protein DPMN_010716 [Dreissena polymorpha]
MLTWIRMNGISAVHFNWFYFFVDTDRWNSSLKLANTCGHLHNGQLPIFKGAFSRFGLQGSVVPALLRDPEKFDRQTHRQTDTLTDRQTDSHTDSQTDRHTDRHTDRKP